MAPQMVSSNILLMVSLSYAIFVSWARVLFQEIVPIYGTTHVSRCRTYHVLSLYEKQPNSVSPELCQIHISGHLLGCYAEGSSTIWILSSSAVLEAVVISETSHRERSPSRQKWSVNVQGPTRTSCNRNSGSHSGSVGFT